jgi:hypothetical protein
MKRIIVYLTMALLMAAMMAASSIPAFADKEKRMRACDTPAEVHVPFCQTITSTITTTV